MCATSCDLFELFAANADKLSKFHSTRCANRKKVFILKLMTVFAQNDESKFTSWQIFWFKKCHHVTSTYGWWMLSSKSKLISKTNIYENISLLIQYNFSVLFPSRLLNVAAEVGHVFAGHCYAIDNGEWMFIVVGKFVLISVVLIDMLSCIFCVRCCRQPVATGLHGDAQSAWLNSRKIDYRWCC